MGWNDTKSLGVQVHVQDHPRSMPQARSFKMQSGKYPGVPFGQLVNTDPGYILWLHEKGRGAPAAAAHILAPLAAKIREDFEDILQGNWDIADIGEMPW